MTTHTPMHHSLFVAAKLFGVLFLMLLTMGCDSLEQLRLEQLQYFHDTKNLSQQYTSKLKQRLAGNASRTQELQTKYQLAQSTHNRLLGKLKLSISTAQSLSKLNLNDPALLSNDSTYLRYLDALDQSTADEKGFITNLVKSGGSAIKSLLMSSQKATTRTDLINYIEADLLWAPWDEL